MEPGGGGLIITWDGSFTDKMHLVAIHGEEIHSNLMTRVIHLNNFKEKNHPQQSIQNQYVNTDCKLSLLG